SPRRLSLNHEPILRFLFQIRLIFQHIRTLFSVLTELFCESRFVSFFFCCCQNNNKRCDLLLLEIFLVLVFYGKVICSGVLRWMKRGREDTCPGSEAKRPQQVASQNGDAPGQSQLGGNSVGASSTQIPGNGLTTSVALHYLRAVKEKFSDNKGKYDEFLEVMKDFKALKIDTKGVIERVKQLFKGHTNLILGFNTFLPQGYAITLPPENDQVVVKKPVDFGEAIGFVNKIKARFHNNDHVYKSFLEILNMYKRESKSINEVFQEVASLFRDDVDLLEEFQNFLPNNSGPHGTSDFVIRDRSYTLATIRQMHTDRRDNRDFTVNCPDRNHDKSSMRVDKELWSRGDRSRERREDRDKRELERDDEDYVHDGGMPGLLTKPKVADGCFSNQGGDGAETYGARIYSQEFGFCEKVKERLHNPFQYHEFLKRLLMYSSEVISVKELQDQVQGILGEFPDLMDDFDQFLARCEKKDGFLAGVISKKYLWDDGHLPKSAKVEDGEREWDSERDDVNHDHEGKEKKSHPVTDRNVFYRSKEIAHRMSLNSDKEKFMGKPIQELDLSNCKSCTPSYRLLPKNYPVPLVSHRTELGAEVLNDDWVSVTSGSEDYSFKHMRKNQFEESLFRCEDDRFELDMLLESVNVTIRRVEELLDKINHSTIRMDIPIRIEEQLTALHLRCIERLYGDHGLDVMDVLKKNAALALPVVLTRLKQKQEEWARCRADFNKVWAEIYAKNYYKSLDHRSFYFKQQDSKSLSTKAFLAEIKEISDQMHKDDNVLLAIAAGDHHPSTPHMVFEYGDMDIHQDLCEFVKCYCMRYLPEHSDKLLKIWTSFLEPMLGISAQPQAKEDIKIVKTNIGNDKIGGSMCYSGGSPNGRESNPPRRADEDVLPEQLSSRNNVAEDGSLNSDNTPLLGKRQSNGHVFDEMIVPSKRAPSNEQKASSSSGMAHVRERTENTSGHCSGTLDSLRPGFRTLGGRHESNVNGESIPSLEVVDYARAAPSFGGNGTEASRDLQHEESDELFKIEREEGELSPNGDFEDNFAVCGYANPNGTHKQIDTAVERPGESRPVGGECCGDGRENEADADDEGEESAQRSTEESENASDKSGEVSGSESGEGEDCSRGGREEDGHHDNKAESEGEAGGMSDAPDEGDGTSLLFPERFLQTVKPLAKHVPLALDEKTNGSQVFYGNDSFYVLFRLHQTLYERVLSAKLNSSVDERKWRSTSDMMPTDLYTRFRNAVLNLLGGNADNLKFEDDCRAIIGAQSYILFTVDKLIYKLVKQLQLIAADEIGNKLLQLYLYENSRKLVRFHGAVYHENARVLLQDENIYRIERHSVPSTRLSIQLLENGHNKTDITAVSLDPSFWTYLQSEFLVDLDRKEKPGIFLKRNKLKQGYGDDLSSTNQALEGVQLVNGLEGRMACSTSKIYYVFDTEDLLWRSRRRRKSSLRINSNSIYRAKNGNFIRVQKFQRWMDSLNESF
ncbi:hypothetical protein Dimus_015015, partial [Dionaea muscipula]